MNIIIEYEASEKMNIPYRKLITDAVTKTLETEGCPCGAEVNVLLTDADVIHEMNRDFRNIDRTTDVLSFPAMYFEKPGDFGFLKTNGAASLYNPDTGDLMLGDIAVSVPKIKEQAKAYEHTQRRELSFLITHSMLHLLGYDHIEDSDRLLMENRQKIIMNALNINR